MSKQLFDHVNQFIPVSEQEFTDILSYFESERIDKKGMLLEAGSPCNRLYFVLEGCLNMFFTSEAGIERTVQFAIEGWWLTDFLAFQKGTQTDFNIQAVSNSQLLRIDREQYEKLLLEHPKFEAYFRNIYQIAYGASLVKMKYMLDFSKEDMYFHFTEQFPKFAQRVPQKLIASFLGLTPEYVSEIRAKRRS